MFHTGWIFFTSSRKKQKRDALNNQCPAFRNSGRSSSILTFFYTNTSSRALSGQHPERSAKISMHEVPPFVAGTTLPDNDQ